MAQIIFNGLSSQALNLLSYNRTTSLGDNGEIISSAFIQVAPGQNVAAQLTNLMSSGVTHILIKNGDTPIYTLANLTGRVDSIQENFNGQDAVDIYMNLSTNMPAGD